MLKPGEKIPLNVKVLNELNEEVTLESYLGKTLVLYFYPKDQTPGCTKEACSFRDLNKEIEKTGSKVIGISSDNQSSHAKFKKNHNLTFELLSDPERKLQESFGVWGEKRMFGKTYMGTIRSTFIVDKDGTVLTTWGDEGNSVDVNVHSTEILNYLKSLNK